MTRTSLIAPVPWHCTALVPPSSRHSDTVRRPTPLAAAAAVGCPAACTRPSPQMMSCGAPTSIWEKKEEGGG